MRRKDRFSPDLFDSFEQRLANRPGRGLFVTFDGPNGVGKSSVITRVASSLRRYGFPVTRTREPTASPLGRLVRAAESRYPGTVLACLVAADRYFHVERLVLPALNEGNIVLSDRYVESSLVLQCFDGVTRDFVWALNSNVLRPDLSIIITATPSTIEGRLAGRSRYSRFERSMTRDQEVQSYGQAAGFLQQAGFNVLVVENDGTPLAEIVAKVTQQILGLLRKGPKSVVFAKEEALRVHA